MKTLKYKQDIFKNFRHRINIKEQEFSPNSSSFFKPISAHHVQLVCKRKISAWSRAGPSL